MKIKTPKSELKKKLKFVFVVDYNGKKVKKTEHPG